MNDVRELAVSPGILEAAATLRVNRLAVETVRVFQSAGVPSILLKGASFAGLWYPEGGRCYGDVDLLVRAPDVAVATDALQRLGFRPDDEQAPVIDRDRDARTFGRRNADGLKDSVDLHWNLHNVRVDPEHTWSALAARTTSLPLGSASVQVLDTVGCAMHVALHAAHHGLHGPEPHNHGSRTGADLRRALRMVAPADWVQAAELAAELGIEDAFALGLRLHPEGVGLAEQLHLTTAVPEAWRFTGKHATRGALRINRVRVAPSWRERVALMRPVLCPSRVRIRRDARSRLGRRVFAAAYVEYWLRVAAALPASIHDGLSRVKSHG
jgi:hypothetical protein